MFSIFLSTLCFLWVIMITSGLRSLENRDKNKKILEDKWGRWGIIALGLAILGFLAALVYGWVIWNMAWGSDF
jgi:hypothetical protein